MHSFLTVQAKKYLFLSSHQKCYNKRGTRFECLSSFVYSPMQLVAPSAVSIAVAMLAIICTIHFIVSFFVIAYLLS